jgi:hypothetical protein
MAEIDMPVNTRRVWIAYYSDWSGFVIYREELHALRAAVSRSMEVSSVPFGVDPRQHIEQKQREAMEAAAIERAAAPEGDGS